MNLRQLILKSQIFIFPAKREIDGFDELKSRLDIIGWPMINSGELGRILDWVEVYAMLNKLFGFNFILSNYVYLDAKDTSIYSLYVSLSVKSSEMFYFLDEFRQ